MKKQTKLFTTLSAAALLTIGISAVSMAAGWDNSTGEWRYLDNDGTAVTDTWKSANGNWFYLNSDGVMATNQLIEDNSNSKVRYYYVDQYGAMVKNTWKAVAMDDSNDNLDAEYWWYYFGSDGKAYTSEAPLTSSKIKTINGQKYAFDEEGHMLYGWVDKDNLSQQDDDEDAWAKSQYFFNGWNDGHMQTGWIQLTVHDATNEDDETQTYWFNFKSSGEKRVKKAKVNGVYYYFDNEDGHMITDWGTASMSVKKAGGASSSEIVYLNGDGSMRKNKWVWAVPDEKYIQKDYDEDNYRWWYFNNSGKLVTDQIKKINGRSYAFDDLGRMKFAFVTANGTKNVLDAGKGDDWTRETWLRGYNDDDEPKRNDQRSDIYFFSTDEEKDGSMKKGYQTIALDDASYQFYFDTSNGKAKSGYVSKIKKYVNKGLVLAPTNDDSCNYALISGVDTKHPTISFANDFKGNNNTHVVGKTLVNTSGTKVTTKAKLKDNNDAYYIVNKNGVVLKYFESEDDYNKYVGYTVKDNDTEKHVTVSTKWLGANATPDTLDTEVKNAIKKIANATPTWDEFK